MQETLNDMTPDQRLLLRGFHKLPDGKEKAKHIDELFALKVFYEKSFGETLNILEIHIPPKPAAGEWWRLHIGEIPRNMFRKNFHWELVKMLWDAEGSVKSDTNKEEMELYCQTLTSLSRTAAFQPYAVWLPDRSSAPEEIAQGFDWTLEEVLLDEIRLFQETGNFYGNGQEVICYGTIDFLGNHPVVCREIGDGRLCIKTDNMKVKG